MRVAIARAVYADCDTIILDDPLAAVDSHVAAALFYDLIVTKLKDKAVLLITNQVQGCDNSVPPSPSHPLFKGGGCLVDSGEDTLMGNMALQYASFESVASYLCYPVLADSCVEH